MFEFPNWFDEMLGEKLCSDESVVERVKNLKSVAEADPSKAERDRDKRISPIWW